MAMQYATKPEATAPGLSDAQRPIFGTLFFDDGGLFDEQGNVILDRAADSLGMSKTQLAEAVGLGRESLYKATRSQAPKIQNRIREMLDIITRVTAWAGGRQQAMAWYRAQPIPAFGGRTAESLVKTGKATAVRDYLDHMAMGGFA